jgi:hypothetical protein
MGQRAQALLTVTKGDRLIGFILSRGMQGVKAFDSLERSIGLLRHRGSRLTR